MGQYYYICNLDKHEYLHPHKFGDGLKLIEFGSSGEGIMMALAYLLADGNGRGGGDIHNYSEETDQPFSGRWAGDRIVVAGDYADPGFTPSYTAVKAVRGQMMEGYEDHYNLHHYAEDFYKDISDEVIKEIASVKRHTAISTINIHEDGWRGKSYHR